MAEVAALATIGAGEAGADAGAAADAVAGALAAEELGTPGTVGALTIVGGADALRGSGFLTSSELTTSGASPVAGSTVSHRSSVYVSSDHTMSCARRLNPMIQQQPFTATRRRPNA
jgi:hypothetical protein